MLFNEYIWSLYKASDEGGAFIRSCAPVIEFEWDESNLQLLTKKDAAELESLGLGQYLKKDETGTWANVQQLYHHFFREEAVQLSTKEDFERKFTEWIEEGIIFKGFTLIPPRQYELWMTDIGIISNALYAVFPEWAFPYFYADDFAAFNQICSFWEIPLSPIPIKSHLDQRVLYYLEICRSLYEFRYMNGLDYIELVGFIYGFSIDLILPKTSDTKNQALPIPSKVWLIGASSIDFETIDTATSLAEIPWQCNREVRPGDILIMYCRSPRSYIHSVWLACSEAHANPFFFYYFQARIGHCQKVPTLSLETLRTNSIISKSGIVKKNFQGVNGYPVTYEEYQEMLRLWAEKGFDVELLPKLQPLPGIDDSILLADERDVEQYLVEPLLDKLGFKSKDWMRQMPIRMGRGERYYPDYCFFPNTRRGEESAVMVLEAKWSIHNARELREAFLQARSYAVRLQANRFILAAKEGIWVFESLSVGFREDKHHFFSWQDLTNPDTLHRLLLLTGRTPTRLGKRT